MKISLILEWLFASLLLSSLLCLIGQCLIKSYRLKHSFYQFGFILLLTLPLACLISRSHSDPAFTVSSTAQKSIDSILVGTADTAPSKPLTIETRESSTVVATSAAPTAVATSMANAELNVPTESQLVRISIIVILGYLLASIILFLKQYISLSRYCSKLPELKHSIPGVRAKVRLSKDYAVPFCFGIFKPVIIIPDEISDDREIRMVMMHENGHIKNFDPQFSPIQFFVKACFFWNPLVWILNRKFNETQEILADYDASKAARNPHRYAETIVNLIKRSRNLNIPALSSGMASKKHQLLVRFNAIINENNNMKLTHPIIKKAGLGLTTLLVYSVILQTGLFARDGEGLKVETAALEEANPNANGQKMEIIGVQSMKNKQLVLESLDGKTYTIVNHKEQIKGGFLRLGQDVLYCEVTLVNQTPEGGDVVLGVWGNGSPMTEEGKDLQVQLWPQIKAKKKELGHDQWLRFHGNKAHPNEK